MADEDRRRLYQHARLSLSEQDAINNLIHLGARVIKVSCFAAESLFGRLLTKQDPKASTKGRIKQKFVSQEGEYELSRFKPIVHTVLEVSFRNPPVP